MQARSTKLSSAFIYFRPGVTCNKSRLRAISLQTDSWERSQHPVLLPRSALVSTGFQWNHSLVPSDVYWAHLHSPELLLFGQHISFDLCCWFHSRLNPENKCRGIFQTFNLSLEHTWLHPSGRKSLPSLSQRFDYQLVLLIRRISSRIFHRNDFPLLHVECILHFLPAFVEKFRNFPADWKSTLGFAVGFRHFFSLLIHRVNTKSYHRLCSARELDVRRWCLWRH